MTRAEWIHQKMRGKGYVTVSSMHRDMVMTGVRISRVSLDAHMKGTVTPSPRTMDDYERFFGSKYPG